MDLELGEDIAALEVEVRRDVVAFDRSGIVARGRWCLSATERKARSDHETQKSDGRVHEIDSLSFVVSTHGLSLPVERSQHFLDRRVKLRVPPGPDPRSPPRGSITFLE